MSEARGRSIDESVLPLSGEMTEKERAKIQELRSVLNNFYVDFAALKMRAGMSDNEEEFWENMDALANSHEKSGFGKILVRTPKQKLDSWEFIPEDRKDSIWVSLKARIIPQVLTRLEEIVKEVNTLYESRILTRHQVVEFSSEVEKLTF
ncbi:MAG: hypothetical protein HY983_03050 [Candidatus Magasanikbacteria bacterium]|nr:hypothetical protein [Candidatus Magasanikbacteria bacterium]